MASAQRVLEVRGLTKTFGEFTAVNSLSFDQQPGEILGFLGVNGAGKTTAMNMILGLLTPTSGNIAMFGEELAPNRIRLIRRTNFSSAYTNLPNNLKVWQNLRVFADLYRVSDWKAKSRRLLELFEIPHLYSRVTGELSSGEATRVNLCKALINDPELLLLDEPTASLDPDIADKVRKIIRRLQRDRNLSILYTSHNMRDVEEVCDRVIFMHRGRILCQGTPDDIVRHFRESSLEEVFIRVARGGDVEEASA